ncbi:hypothetical protein [Metabacillus sp. B2-18]|uniref:hypothetical protein n=1 Tax=Metabacillus sp. B2-18 TaxID=2897333 RepID=UPI001E627539|nr:hypothetical protein [Metabacillus sp. B2-18]UGB30723.1 hypothetical protein LPC09_24000 [Metabacillus sp. B2-18]
MELLLLFNLSVVMILTFTVMKKGLNPLENIFMFMVLEFFITSYFSILYVNTKVWELTNDVSGFIAFRLFEVILLPFAYLIYFNLRSAISKKLGRIVLLFVTVFITLILEKVLVILGIIKYKNWEYYLSFLLIIVLMLVIQLLQVTYKKLLKKEGIWT